MLMRLRQICVHPCLLKMYESAYDVHDTRAPEAKRILEDATNLGKSLSQPLPTC